MKKRFSQEQIIAFLKEADADIGSTTCGFSYAQAQPRADRPDRKSALATF
ncbi:hypothetical protein SAMN05216315_1404 [Nitrosospira sp. Nsp18]|nr:hypothetical protein [Nitrosospira sp. Nsp18]SDA28851.1 hypothetical protein SAMN05216315_1404 [Nitrosospira sp. Nsp18]